MSWGFSGEIMLILASSLLTLAGILWAWWRYGELSLGKEVEAGPSFFQNLLFHGYFVDQLYERFLVRPARTLARWLFQFDAGVIDGAVDGSATLAQSLSRLTGRYDETVVDGAVNGIARLIEGGSLVLRRLQTGQAQQYLFAMAAGVLALVVLFLLFSEGLT